MKIGSNKIYATVVTDLGELQRDEFKTGSLHKVCADHRDDRGFSLLSSTSSRLD